MVIIMNSEQCVSTLTVLSIVYTQVSTFALLGIVTFLIIDNIRVTTAEVTITIARFWTASCARLASWADRVYSISILSISTMCAVVSWG